MRVLATMKRFPGGLMVIPLLLGCILNTVDQARLAPIQSGLKALGAPVIPWKDLKGAVPVDTADLAKLASGKVEVTRADGSKATVGVDTLATAEGTVLIDGAAVPAAQAASTKGKLTVQDPGNFEMLRIGGFVQALFKDSALPLIALFLFCVGSQMNVRVGGRALKKGLALTIYKWAIGVGIGYLLGTFSDPFHSIMGLSFVAIIAGMTNENGGMFAALTGQYGNKSDRGALAILSINDGPFLTLVALGLLGHSFPFIAFLAVLLPILIGMILGNLDHELSDFLATGEALLIPFFAFALGAGLNLGVFLDLKVLAGGLTLGVGTVVIIGGAGILVMRLLGERSGITGPAGGSVAGNAIGTPKAVATAAIAAGAAGSMAPEQVKAFQDVVPMATAQLSVAVVSTALLCPFVTAWWHRVQLRRGIDGTQEPT